LALQARTSVAGNGPSEVGLKSIERRARTSFTSKGLSSAAKGTRD
jgi:hypothetical protein